MLSKKIEDALNEQINAEFWSGYLYLSMSCHFADKGLDGVANWFRIQFQEERPTPSLSSIISTPAAAR